MLSVSNGFSSWLDDDEISGDEVLIPSPPAFFFPKSQQSWQSCQQSFKNCRHWRDWRQIREKIFGEHFKSEEQQTLIRVHYSFDQF